MQPFDSSEPDWRPPADGKASAWVDLFDREPPPSPADTAWAAEAAGRLDQLSPQELARYDAISRAFLASRQQLPAPTIAELAWVLELEAKHQAGAEPGPEENARLWDISARFLLEQQAMLEAAFAGLPDAPTPPSGEDLRWAQALQLAASQGQLPSPEDYQRFLAILKASRQQS